jgi:hypothetical protein
MPHQVRHAIYGLWASFAISCAFGLFQAFTNQSSSEILFALCFFAFTFFVNRKIAAGQNWARLLYLVLLVTTYVMAAMDTDGFSTLDFIALILSAPIDIFVILRLFGEKATAWFLSK